MYYKKPMKTKKHISRINSKTNKTIKKKIHPDISIKNDYYGFINQKWIKTHSSQKQTYELNIFTEMQDNVNKDLISVIHHSKSMKKMFESFLHTTDPSIKEIIMEKVQQIDTFCKNPDNFYPFLA